MEETEDLKLGFLLSMTLNIKPVVYHIYVPPCVDSSHTIPIKILKYLVEMQQNAKRFMGYIFVRHCCGSLLKLLSIHILLQTQGDVFQLSKRTGKQFFTVQEHV